MILKQVGLGTSAKVSFNTDFANYTVATNTVVAPTADNSSMASFDTSNLKLAVVDFETEALTNIIAATTAAATAATAAADFTVITIIITYKLVALRITDSK